jgi:hypothetical protein
MVEFQCAWHCLCSPSLVVPVFLAIIPADAHTIRNTTKTVAFRVVDNLYDKVVLIKITYKNPIKMDI